MIFVVPQKFSMEKQTLMRALGAEIVNTETALGMQGAIEKAAELVAETFQMLFHHLNFLILRIRLLMTKTLGPELWRDLDGQIDVFVAGAGSGGTFMGTSTFLKERNANRENGHCRTSWIYFKWWGSGFACDRRNRNGVFTCIHGSFLF